MKQQDAYLKSVLKTRTAVDQISMRVESRIFESLSNAFDELTRVLKLTNKDSISYTLYQQRRAEIAKIIVNMAQQVGTITRFGIKAAADEVVDASIKAQSSISGMSAQTLLPSYTQVPMQAVRSVVNRVYSDGFSFSDRVWKMSEMAQSAVKDIIAKSIVNGTPAVQAAKELQQYLLSPEITPGTSWTTKVSPAVAGRGTINYNALRLARTEINHGYREASAMQNEKSPIMLGVKWNLSATHSVPDICDVWAQLDQYGMGQGVYPADRVPIDHPNGRCFLSDVLRPAQEWGQPKEQYEAVEISKEDVFAVLENESIKPWQREAAFRAFENVNTLISKELRRKAA